MGKSNRFSTDDGYQMLLFKGKCKLFRPNALFTFSAIAGKFARLDDTNAFDCR
jgi:hypothetical protein